MEEDSNLAEPLLEAVGDVPPSSSATASSGKTTAKSVSFGEDVTLSPSLSRPASNNPPASSIRELPRKTSYVDRRSAWPRSLSDRSDRGDHMEQLVQSRRESMKLVLGPDADDYPEVEDPASSLSRMSASVRRAALEDQSAFVTRLRSYLERTGYDEQLPPLEIRLAQVNYRVPSRGDTGENSIATIWNSSPLYNIQKFGKKILRRGEEVDPVKEPRVTNVLTDVNLVLRPRRMYLVIGPPLSGKTSLLRAIAGNLQGEFKKKQRPGGGEGLAHLTGRVLYNNLVAAGDDADDGLRTLVKNLGAFVRQTDSHAPRLTVGETFLFAGECKDDQILKNKRGYDPLGKVGVTLEGLNLAYVKDTYVGNESIRGVSGGQRRRVTLGEMLVFDTPLLCGDEISTGLDTASTVEILSILSFVSRLLNQTTIISLLQPSPEAVSLFDEIILLSDGGRVIYSGPTENATAYFHNLGYAQPESMDNADYLLGVSSSDRHLLYRGEGSASGGAHTTEELAELFRGSQEYAKVEEGLRAEWDEDWRGVLGNATAPGSGGGEDEGGPGHVERYSQKYKNPFWTSVVLNMKRSFKLWKRDRTFIRAGIIKNLAMGLSVGAVFLNTNVNSSFFGVLFQGNLFIMLGAMTSAPDKVDDRAIFYKHADSNFYPALAYIIGQALALIPQMLIDVLLFGICVYWMVGFVATAKGFFIYLALFFSFNFTMGQLFGCLASFAPSRTVVQAGGALILLLNTLFCGYIVAPTVIPPYYIWLYWSMPLSWVYRALLLNEFTSKDYQDGSGDEAMEAFGFLHNNEPYSRDWIAYCFAYLLPFCGLCMILSAVCLTKLRLEGAQTGTPDMPTEEEEGDTVHELSQDDTPQDFVPVNLSFENLSYEVKASKGSEQVTLLDNISGIFQAGRMCALMGESGAGKTTLLDVISMRKQSGNITGDIKLNGFPQEAIGFRRCSGYVEQFDVQSAELTVRETIRFSAELRLESSDPVYDSEGGIEGHIDTIIKALELTREADVLVGSEDDGGLTFEQKKRLSIAVELAASPSIVFLDEPTSGLDARAAMLVMSGLRKICDSGRTVVATIHQPSSAVFDKFDDLLLLKKGGKTVFFGELGPCSSNLVHYFEGLGCSPMKKGENPATWMLNAIAEKIMPAGGDERFALDFSAAWQDSQNNQDLKDRLTEIIESKDEALEIKYGTQFAASRGQRNTLMARRLVTIYWRSPAYNLSRMMLSLLIATLLSTVFIPIRRKEVLEEAEMVSYLSTIFISFIIIGVLSITSVLPVMLSIRDMYYRHKEAGMLDSRSVARALATAEKRFILISSVLFCAVFILVSGIDSSAEPRRRAAQWIGFWGFFTFNAAIYSYIGQLFMCSVRGQGTAQILASIFIGINNFFSGLIVRPQQMTGLWKFTYWINPGHYVYEGLCMVVFSRAKNRFVDVATGSDYYDELCVGAEAEESPCQVTVASYVNAFFGGLYTEEHIPRNIIILGAILFLVRALTFVALRSLTYSSK